jgi:hypothetical protein
MCFQAFLPKSLEAHVTTRALISTLSREDWHDIVDAVWNHEMCVCVCVCVCVYIYSRTNERSFTRFPSERRKREERERGGEGGGGGEYVCTFVVTNGSLDAALPLDPAEEKAEEEEEEKEEETCVGRRHA